MSERKIIILFLVGYILFGIISSFVGRFSVDFGFALFLLTCIAIPFYICHLLSGYISGKLGVASEFDGNLLLSVRFLGLLKGRVRDDDCVARLIIVFFVIYAFAVFGLIFAFIFRQFI